MKDLLKWVNAEIRALNKEKKEIEVIKDNEGFYAYLAGRLEALREIKSKLAPKRGKNHKTK